MVEKFKPLMEAGKVVDEAEAELDRVLEQLAKGTSEPAAAEAIPQDASSYAERLPPKIHRIQKELPAWVEKPGNKEKATAFMQKLKEQLDAMNFREAEKTADSILETMGVSHAGRRPGGDNKPQRRRSPRRRRTTSQNALRKRSSACRQSSKMGSQRTRSIGHRQAMVEKFEPLLEAGKFVEAEPELDRVLEQLEEGASATSRPPKPSPRMHRPTRNACLPRFIESRRNSPPGLRSQATRRRPLHSCKS